MSWTRIPGISPLEGHLYFRNEQTGRVVVCDAAHSQQAPSPDYQYIDTDRAILWGHRMIQVPVIEADGTRYRTDDVVENLSALMSAANMRLEVPTWLRQVASLIAWQDAVDRLQRVAQETSAPGPSVASE